MGKSCLKAHTGRLRTRTTGKKKYVTLRRVVQHIGALLDELKDSICGHWTDTWWWLTPCHIQERPKDSLLDLGKT